MAALLDEVGLPAGVAAGYPHLLSALEAQRVMLATALAGLPRVLLVDDGPVDLEPEPRQAFSALVAQVAASRGLTTLVVAHRVTDVAQHVDQLAVLCGGLIVEQSTPEVVAASALVPYTRHLLEPAPPGPPDPRSPASPAKPAEPRPRRRWRRQAPRAGIPEGDNLFVGCSFSLRCPRAVAACAEDEPPLVERQPGHRLACWNPEPVALCDEPGPVLPG